MHVEGQKWPQKCKLPRLWWWIDASCPPPKARGIWHTCRDPWDRSVHVSGRFYAAAAPSFVPWAMHPEGQKWPKKGLMAQLFRLDRCLVRPPRQRHEASETPVGALGATLCMYRVGSKQQPPRRVVPWVMHVEGQKWPKRANYLAVGGGSTPRALRQCPRHLTHLWGH